MEMTEYEMPTSWDDKGMNWDNPDPANADYVMAIRQALAERCALFGGAADDGVHRITPWQPVTATRLWHVVQTIWRIAGEFVNLDFEDYAEDWSDFPKMWTYRDLVQERGCRLYEGAKYGSLVENGGEWLKQIRNAIDRLTVIRVPWVHGKSVICSGSVHDPPFDESIGTAMRHAMDSMSANDYDSIFPQSVYAWSGNTHWKCPDPDYKGDHPEENQDGYCGYAMSEGYTITAAKSRLLGAQYDIFAAVIVTEPTGPVNYSTVLDESVFDSGGTDFKRGLNWTKRVRVKDTHDFEFKLGDAETIPKNEIVPVSEFDDKGTAVTRHSVKRGWVGASYGFMDYAVEGGFRFYAKEG